MKILCGYNEEDSLELEDELDAILADGCENREEGGLGLGVCLGVGYLGVRGRGEVVVALLLDRSSDVVEVDPLEAGVKHGLWLHVLKISLRDGEVRPLTGAWASALIADR